jgi:hypothetical protein
MGREAELAAGLVGRDDPGRDAGAVGGELFLQAEPLELVRVVAKTMRALAIEREQLHAALAAMPAMCGRSVLST